MAAFPTGVAYDWRDLGSQPESVVLRQPMERGRPKQRRTNSDVRIEISLTVHFDTLAQARAFEDWFFDTINAGQDSFDILNPWTGTVVLARVVGGELGPQMAANRTLDASKRTLKIEYWRSAW
jgi:hypothetical protein